MDSTTKVKLTPVFENLESAIKIWWKNLKKFVFVYLWGLLFAVIPIAVLAIVWGAYVWLSQSNGGNPVFSIISIIIGFISVLFAIYFSIRGLMASFLLVKKNYAGDELAIFKETKPYFWSYLGLTILTAVLVLLWCLLLIIPGIIYGVFYTFACYAFFFEDKKGMAAIRRSTQLVAGYWWPVFGRLVAFGLMMWIFMLIISIPLYSTDRGTWLYNSWNTVVQIISFLTGPIALLYNFRLYQDLVKIKGQTAVEAPKT